MSAWPESDPFNDQDSVSKPNSRLYPVLDRLSGPNRPLNVGQFHRPTCPEPSKDLQ